MSHNFKPVRTEPPQPSLIEQVSLDVHPKEREKVAQLIAAGKSGLALDFAKDVHKRRHNASSEELLLDAYGARLAHLVERNLDREAQALMDLVRERYPAAGNRLREWNAGLAARHGDLSALVEPLNVPELPAERQAELAQKVRREVRDLRALAECQTLAAEHPLRIAAGALHRAFEAVTGGPVPDEALALPEVSRHSPLAPWKMLVRAIAAFYRRDDDLCGRCVAAIEPDSAPARLAPALRALLRQPQTLTPAATALVAQAGGNLDELCATLKRLDAALNRRLQPLILQEISRAVTICGQAEPGLLERLKQHISIRALLADSKADKVAAAMGGPSLRNAYFWRLLARAFEDDKNEPMSIPGANSAWEEFRKHAIREAWFPAKGPEVATLYLHMADELRHVSDDEGMRIRMRFERSFDGHAGHYKGQPVEIRALMPDRDIRHLYYLSTDELLERACEADPCAENFHRWLRYAVEASPDTSDKVAERWCAALPKDIPPLLHLMQSAEKRNALQKAFKYMERAEQIDGLNADVRRARLRLLVAMAARHLREKKPHLAEKELRQIAALPQAQQGDRPAFVAALRWVWCSLQFWPAEAADAQKEAARILGDAITSYILLLNVEHWCDLRESDLGKPPRPTVPLFAAMGRVCALGDDMGMPVTLSRETPDIVMEELAEPKLSADPRALVALGEAALREEHYPMAYVTAGAGLAQGADQQGRFLFMRARSLPPWEEKRRQSCLAAATELARRHHDADLLSRIGDWREDLLEFETPEVARAAISSEEIAGVVRRELEERDFPQSAPPAAYGYDDDDDDDGECQCPECCAARGMLPELPPELRELVEQMGPEAVAQALAEMIGIGGKKKRGKRRRALGLDDFSF